MRMRSLYLFGSIALAAVTLHGQTYYTNPAPDCTPLNENPIAIVNSSGTTIGYSCWAEGTFVWFAAGGPSTNTWTSAIRVAAPSTGAVNADYTFYDDDGNNLNLDTTLGAGAAKTSGNEVNVTLNPNQPLEVDMLGATSNAPSYSTTQTGSAYAEFLCPDATTCGNVLPQLLYSALPSVPWSLSVPIVWDNATWSTWSAEGIDDGATRRVSFVVYNEDLTSSTPTSFTFYVYDGNGNLAGTGTTRPIAPIPVLSDGYYGEGGTYGDYLSNVVTTKLPSGTFKIIIDGGVAQTQSAVEVLQFTGASATTLEVGYDTSPTSITADASARHRSFRNARGPMTRRVAAPASK